MKTKVSKKAEKELANLCDKMYLWAKKYKVNYISPYIYTGDKRCKASNATYCIDVDSNDRKYINIEGEFGK